MFNCLTENKSSHEYILPFNNDVAQLIKSKQLKAVEARFQCKVKIKRTVLNRKSSVFGWNKFSLITIDGPNEQAVNMCNKLLEKYFPFYIKRQEHVSLASTVMFTTEDLPDNTHLYSGCERLGASVDKYNGLNLISQYKCSNRYNNSETCNWQLHCNEWKGIYYPVHYNTDQVVDYQQSNSKQYLSPTMTNKSRTCPTKVAIEKKKLCHNKGCFIYGINEDALIDLPNSYEEIELINMTNAVFPENDIIRHNKFSSIYRKKTEKKRKITITETKKDSIQMPLSDLFRISSLDDIGVINSDADENNDKDNKSLTSKPEDHKDSELFKYSLKEISEKRESDTMKDNT